MQKEVQPLHSLVKTAALSLAAAVILTVPALGEGTEILGPPAITIESGTGIAAAGVGLRYTQPGVIDLDVPAGTIVKQVLMYWEGQMTTNVPGDDTIVVNGFSVTGTLIGGPAFFFSGAYSSSFRADITNLGLVAPGSNMLTVEGLSYTRRNNGAGVLVIYDDGGDAAEIELRDGIDLAYIGFPDPRKDTIPQTFFFTPADEERTASLIVSASGVGGTSRPNSIEITVDFTTTYLSNLLFDSSGPEWDSLTIPVTIPANASMLTVQLFSRDDYGTGDNPASLAWTCAALSVPAVVPEGPFEGLTPGYWKQTQHFWAWVGYDRSDDYETVFGVNASFNKDLLGALKQGGGGEKALGRHAVAALLNAASPDINYYYSQAQVIAIVQNAYATGNFESAKDLLEDQNELGD